MFFYVYVLQSKNDAGLYVGFTQDLQNRLEKHNHKNVQSTKHGAPWQRIHDEAYRNQEDARRREQYRKTNQGARLLKRMLKEFLYKQSAER